VINQRGGCVTETGEKIIIPEHINLRPREQKTEHFMTLEFHSGAKRTTSSSK
jgi:hypothetical protein